MTAVASTKPTKVRRWVQTAWLDSTQGRQVAVTHRTGGWGVSIFRRDGPGSRSFSRKAPTPRYSRYDARNARAGTRKNTLLVHRRQNAFVYPPRFRPPRSSRRGRRGTCARSSPPRSRASSAARRRPPSRCSRTPWAARSRSGASGGAALLGLEAGRAVLSPF